MRHASLGFYHALSRLLPGSYVGKLLAVALIGTQLPILCLLAYVTIYSDFVNLHWGILIIAFATVLSGAVLTAHTLRRLIAPLVLSSRALRDYVTDGRLPSGQELGEAIEQVDRETGASPSYYMINCAHPTHFASVLEQGDGWQERIRGLRANASTRSHAELDEADELDEGDPVDLGARYAELSRRLPCLNVLGGCCGTDHRHVAEIRDAWLASSPAAPTTPSASPAPRPPSPSSPSPPRYKRAPSSWPARPRSRSHERDSGRSPERRSQSGSGHRGGR
jgi:hypothetical protein